MVKLGVNIDHVATLREARKGSRPDPIEASSICIAAGCDSIVCHLREDRRHINDQDVKRLRRAVKGRLNLEMSVADGIVKIACALKPDQATLVPEKRKEVTTEGGLDVVKYESRIKSVVSRLEKRGIDVSLFIDPYMEQIEASARTGARIIELHTGEYANAGTQKVKSQKLNALKKACEYAIMRGMEVNAGHGLDYMNVRQVARIKGMNELNIGHSIISRAIFVGVDRAVREMLELIR
ncbi:MAG: pyridoxine 5'-phosphate synthase [Candidatus Omnitrophota bacterium]|jgi:pyridoxine 5-phosphate synthase